MSLEGLRHFNLVQPGYTPPLNPKPEDFVHLAMANWDYERCDNGQNIFRDWDAKDRWLTYGESYAEGPGYKYRYWESYYIDDADWNQPWSGSGIWVVAIWHYADGYPSNWDNIACVSSTIDFGPDPWAKGRLSERQPGPLVYRESRVYHNKWHNSYGNASLGPIVGTYSYDADVASWHDALYGDGAPGSARFNDSLVAGGAAYWRSGAARDFQQGIDLITHQYRASGIAHRESVDRVNMPISFPSGTYGEDFSEFPGTWLHPLTAFWMLDGMPTIAAAGLSFGILAFPIGATEATPLTAVARLEFEPPNYTFVDAGIPPDTNDTNIRTDPGGGGGGYIDIELEWPGQNSLVGHSGTLDYTMRSVTPNSFSGHIDFVIEIDYFKQWFQDTIDASPPGNWYQKYDWVITKLQNFIDPQYSWTGTPMPWGGAGTSGLTSMYHRMEWRYNVHPVIWVEVQWPDYYYWIPGEECPPHLRLLQRTDTALGPFENIPVTPECGKALRLMGRDVHQNLIPGKGPRVQPNSYP